jgi:hypothetical protein
MRRTREYLPVFVHGRWGRRRVRTILWPGRSVGSLKPFAGNIRILRSLIAGCRASASERQGYTVCQTFKGVSGSFCVKAKRRWTGVGTPDCPRAVRQVARADGSRSGPTTSAAQGARKSESEHVGKYVGSAARAIRTARPTPHGLQPNGSFGLVQMNWFRSPDRSAICAVMAPLRVADI